MNFAITSTTRDAVCTVRPRGELDAGNAHCVATALDAAVAFGRVVVVDLSRVTFVDCSVLSVLIEAARHAARRDRRMVVTGARPPVDVLFDVFELHATLGVGAGDPPEARLAPTADLSPEPDPGVRAAATTPRSALR